MKKLIVFLFILGSAHLTCFAIPSWVGNPYSMYSQRDYVCGVGVGSSAIDADVAAKADIAGYFSISVNSVSSSFTYSSLDGDVLVDDFSTVASSEVSEKDIVGIEIVLRDSDINGFYSLAVLQRRTAIAYYSSQIPSLESKLFSILSNIRRYIGSLNALKYLKEYTEAYDLYMKNIRIVNALSGSVTARPNTNLTDVRALETSVFSGLKLSIQVKGDSSGQIKSSLENSLTELGFSISYNNDVRNRIVASLNMNDIVLGTNPNKFIQYDFSIKFMDADTRENYMTFSKSGREGQTTVNAAKNKAIYTICKVIKNDFINQFCEKYF